MADTYIQVDNYLFHSKGRITDKDSQLVTSFAINGYISGEEAKGIAKALENNTTLTSISLGKEHAIKHKTIGANSVTAIFKALKTNTTLTSIKLFRSKIGHRSAKAIAEVFKTNTTLTSINLSDNVIGPEGAKAIAAALEKNNTLSRFILTGMP